MYLNINHSGLKELMSIMLLTCYRKDSYIWQGYQGELGSLIVSSPYAFIFFSTFFFLKRTFHCRQPYLPSAMTHTLSVECVSLWITSTSYPSLCLSLNSFQDEIQRTWTSVSPDIGFLIAMKKQKRHMCRMKLPC